MLSQLSREELIVLCEQQRTLLKESCSVYRRYGKFAKLHKSRIHEARARVEQVRIDKHLRRTR